MICIELNDSQLKAIEHLNGPMMVLAGPGSGKTTVIAYRVKQLIEKYRVKPEKILVITFTKASAVEMNMRFKTISEDIYSNRVTFGTFHSIFFKILKSAIGYRVENVLREDERRIALRNIVYNLKIEFEDEDEFLKDISSEISLMKNELIDIDYYNTVVCSSDDFKNIVCEYESFKSKNNKIDFDDMLCICWKVLNQNKSCLEWWQNKYEYVLIDEFQDINRVQYETICMLCQNHRNIFIVGDDDQSIYKFRGARPEFLLRFPNDFKDVSTIVLDINYRSTDSIINLANRIISNNTQRYNKNIVGTDKHGKKPIILESDNTEEEALKISKYIEKLHIKGLEWNEIAVIFRTNIQARAFVDKFMDMNLPFFLKDEMPNIYDYWIPKDMLAYLKLSMDLNRNEDLERIINKPKRYISKLLIHEAKKKSGSMLSNLSNLKDTQIWQRTKLEELEYHLHQIKRKNPYDAFKYIRTVVGYDDYIKQYAEFRKIGTKSLFEIADEISEASKNYNSHEEFLSHVQDFTAELKNQHSSKSYFSDNAVVLTTMHGAKGLEFEAVFIASVIEGIIPHEKSKTADEIEEERRLLYVGVTRAKRLLFLSTVDKRYESKAFKSQFLTEIQCKSQKG